ncbi:hypothetical protein OC846_002152 [Tilletia horrida]|uniref:GATA-type domain-containing protein n=1 Tax=Tilletia horrida TaxID=155126 RepID=A0AAN6JSW3_9BASI|nr:hypothetical protein OC846_002152 [Tilletia horrida]
MALDRNRDILSGTGVQNWNPTTVEAFVLEKTFLEDVVRPLVRALVHSRLQTAGLASGATPGPALRNDLLSIRDALFQGIGSAGASTSATPSTTNAAAPNTYLRNSAAAGPSSAAAHSLINNTAGTGADASADIGNSSSLIGDETMADGSVNHSMTADSSSTDPSMLNFDVSQLGQMRRLTPQQRKRPGTRNRTCEGCGIPHNNKFRRGPNGSGTLCDKCGSKWKKIVDAANQDRELSGNSSLLPPGVVRPGAPASGPNRANGSNSSSGGQDASRDVVASAAAAAAAAAMAAADVVEEQERRRADGQGNSSSQRSNTSPPPPFYPAPRSGQAGPGAQASNASSSRDAESSTQPSPYNTSNGQQRAPQPGSRPSASGGSGSAETASPSSARQQQQQQQQQMAPPSTRPQQEQGARATGGGPPSGGGGIGRTAAQAFLTAMQQRNGVNNFG